MRTRVDNDAISRWYEVEERMSIKMQHGGGQYQDSCIGPNFWVHYLQRGCRARTLCRFWLRLEANLNRFVPHRLAAGRFRLTSLLLSNLLLLSRKAERRRSRWTVSQWRAFAQQGKPSVKGDKSVTNHVAIADKLRTYGLQDRSEPTT